MIIQSVQLVNFRSHDEFLLNCNKKTSLLIGENGSGKTSVLEAIYEALRGKSFKAGDNEILRRGADFYRVELNFCDGKKTVVLFDGKNKQFLVEDKKVSRLPKRNRYPVVLFLPDDLHLVATSPIKRRAYFDRVLAEFDESYSSSLLKYEKSLKQRNELLKRYVKEGEVGRISKSDFFSWNILLAKYGLEIRNRRKQYLEKLNNIYSDVYH